MNVPAYCLNLQLLDILVLLLCLRLTCLIRQDHCNE